MGNNASDRPWRCPHCQEAVDADFDLCWNCGATPDGRVNPDFSPEKEIVSPPDEQFPSSPPLKSIFIIAGLSLMLLMLFTFAIIMLQDYLPPYFDYFVILGVTAVISASVGLLMAMLVTLSDYKRTRPTGKKKTRKIDLLKDKKICPHCLAPNFPREHFCVQCATPLTSHAEIDPLGQVYAMGDAYRKAVKRPIRPFVVIAMWLLFGTQILYLLWVLFAHIGDWIHPLSSEYGPFKSIRAAPSPQSFFATSGGILLIVLLVAVYTAILYKVTKNYFRQRHHEKKSQVGS